MVCRTVQYSFGEEKFTLALPDHVRPAATQHPKSTANIHFTIFSEKCGAYLPLKNLCGEIWYPCTADFTMDCCAVKKKKFSLNSKNYENHDLD